MDNLINKRIVILEEDHYRIDRLKTAVEEMGHLAFVFDKEATFFNNFRPIDADLIIFQSASIERVSRILNTIIFLDYLKPIIIISNNSDPNKSEIDTLIASTLGIQAHVLSPDYQASEIKLKITALLHEPVAPIPEGSFPIIVGNTPEIIGLRKTIAGLALNNDSVLIQGEKGTGKELLAKSIHFASTKSDHAFVKTNLSQQLFESNQDDSKKFPIEIKKIIPSLGSVIDTSKGGATIFFEDIDTIPISFQGVLLQCFEGDLPPNVRVIASSNSKIDPLVTKGAFRKDLYFRLNVIKMDIPPLRERKMDIPLLTDFFINKYCIESGICHLQISPRVKKALTEYHWPTNVEELETFIASKNLINSEELILNKIYALAAENRTRVHDIQGIGSFTTGMNKGKGRVSLKEISKRFSSRIETEILKLVLEKTNWNRKQAAETLAISYKSLLNKIKAYNLN